MGTLFGRIGRSTVVAVALAALLSSQALAVSWNAPVALTGMAAGNASLVTLGTSTAVAVYSNNGRVVTRRSLDSGATWKPVVRVTESGMHPRASGRDNMVDVVWESNGRVRYARSTDAGASFGSPLALSQTGMLVQFPAVGRGPGGVVAVAWQEAKNVPCCDAPWPIRVRVSTDGGATFGPARTLGAGWEPAVAVGNGVVYVAASSPTSVWVNRSRDAGAAWTDSGDFPLSTYGAHGITITAAGKSAYVAYADYVVLDREEEPYSTNWIRFHKTTNRGSSWTTGRNLTPKTEGASAGGPVMSLQAGVLRVLFNRSGVVVYRERPEGGAWSAEQQVSPGTGLEDRAAGVGHATRTIALYVTESTSGTTIVYARSGTP